jgi:hypothetical protein
MKHFKKIAIGLAGGLALSAGLRAESVPLTGNPYTVVVTRNIFGLNPPVAVDPNPAPVEPPVKITPNGIMSIFGQLQVLFKVAGKAGGKEASYILSEGQRQDDIEVTKIDEKSGVVTFNNHGLAQSIPLVAATGTSMPASAPGGGNPVIPGISGGSPGGNFGSSGFNNAFGGRSGTGGINNPGTDNGSNLRPIPTRFNPANQQPALSPEEQIVGMELNRELTKQQVIEGIMPPLPPTPLTPDDATGVGGAPLVSLPPALPR